ncbi:MAG: hypothetical protein RR144_05560 [Clostridia bacterium]
MMPLEVGQVLWLKIKYQIDKEADTEHPMLVYKIVDNYIEVIAIDKTMGKMHQLLHPYNIYINSQKPKEKVIFQDSYAQLNNILTIEYFEDILITRRVEEKLSTNKMNQIFNEYINWHKNNSILENRIVHMTKDDILRLNPKIV